jgi:hypothetical protein
VVSILELEWLMMETEQLILWSCCGWYWNMATITYTFLEC